MGAGHGHALHYHGHSWVHRAPAHHKIVALICYSLMVVATPITWWWAFVAYVAALLGVIASSGVPLGYLLRRLVIETPFLFFALLMPFVSHGAVVEWGGVTLSVPGLWAAVNLVVKGTLGVLASLTLAATTEAPELVRGLERLRLPALLVAILGFMVRYVDLVTSEAARMLIALRSRGFDPRSPRHWPVLARALGALFIRSYERGERVHLAMLSRGYAGPGRGHAGESGQ